MSDDRRREHLALERRLRSMLRTVVNHGEAPTDCLELKLEDEIVRRVVDSIGAGGISWQSHELIEELRTSCLRSGDLDWGSSFADLLAWPLEDGVSDYTVDRIASKMAQLGGPRALESSISSTFLRYRWPDNDGLVPTTPFRFLSRRIAVESIFGRPESVEHVGDRIVCEVEWVAGSLVVCGAFDEMASLPEELVRARWDRLRSRIQGFLEAQHQPPEVVWELSAAPRTAEGQLFPDPQQQDLLHRFITACLEDSHPVPLRIRVPLPISGSSRQLLARCLRARIAPVIVAEDTQDLAIIAGRLQHLPSDGIHAICQRTKAFDRLVDSGMAPPWQADWADARQQLRPLWVASEKVIPESCAEYFQRNREELQPFPVIAIESQFGLKSRKDAEKLLQKISRRRGGGWDRLEELLRTSAISPRLLAPATDRA